MRRASQTRRRNRPRSLPVPKPNRRSVAHSGERGSQSASSRSQLARQKNNLAVGGDITVILWDISLSVGTTASADLAPYKYEFDPQTRRCDDALSRHIAAKAAPVGSGDSDDSQLPPAAPRRRTSPYERLACANDHPATETAVITKSPMASQTSLAFRSLAWRLFPLRLSRHSRRLVRVGSISG